MRRLRFDPSALHSLIVNNMTLITVVFVQSRGRFFTSSSFFYCNETFNFFFCFVVLKYAKRDGIFPHNIRFFFVQLALLHFFCMLKRANVCVDVNLIRREEHGSILSRSLAVCLERIHNIKAFADLFLTRKHCIFALAANATAACNLDQTSIYFFFVKTTTFSYTHT